MNKTELIAKVAESTKLTKVQAGDAVKATFAAITEELAKKEKVQIIGFGTFETRERKARTGRNPADGSTLKIKASTVPAFKAGKALKEEVNKKPAKKAKKK